VTALRILLAALLPIAPLAVSAEEPATGDVSAVRAPVEALYIALADVMKRADELGFEGRYETLRPVVASSYDLAFMASRVLGRRFRDLSPEQQTAWTETFERLTVATYADRFDGFGGEALEVGAVEESTADTRIVRSRIVPTDDDPVDVDYRLRNGGEGWRIVDVYLSGTVSELALRRSEYAGVLKKDGFDALRAKVETKIAEAEADTGS